MTRQESDAVARVLAERDALREVLADVGRIVSESYISTETRAARASVDEPSESSEPVPSNVLEWRPGRRKG